MKFLNRADAGEQLGEFLACCVHQSAFVLAIPLGGVPVAAEVARILGAPLDVVMTADIRLPEAGGVVGGVALGAPPVLARTLLGIHAPHEPIDHAVKAARDALEELRPRLRGDRPLPDFAERTVIVVDEGLETGLRVVAAVRMLRAHGAEQVVVAAPVCSPAAEGRLDLEGVELVYLECPEDFTTTRAHYEDFTPVSEAEALSLLAPASIDAGAEIDGLASPL